MTALVIYCTLSLVLFLVALACIRKEQEKSKQAEAANARLRAALVKILDQDTLLAAAKCSTDHERSRELHWSMKAIIKIASEALKT